MKEREKFSSGERPVASPVSLASVGRCGFPNRKEELAQDKHTLIARSRAQKRGKARQRILLLPQFQARQVLALLRYETHLLWCAHVWAYEFSDSGRSRIARAPKEYRTKPMQNWSLFRN
jgi:hypothetical protein